MPTVNRKAPNERHVQSLIFDKQYWTYQQARDWAQRNGYYVDGYDETETSHRFRQYDPEENRFDYFNEEDENEKGLTKTMGYPKDGDEDNSGSAQATGALQSIASTPWAIREDALQTILNIAARENDGGLQALQERFGRRMKNARKVQIRETRSGNVAVIPVTGPIFKGANLFTEISGATSNEELAKDIVKSFDDPEIGGIVLNIDSPGGTINGTQEVAHILGDRRGEKAVTAYVDGQAASGAYWIASAADRIVIPRTGLVGSIGVVATMRRNKGGDYREVVSSASPHKRPDVDTEEGYQQVLGYVNDLADEFIADVAAFRGVSDEYVRENFGKGGLRVGKKAVKFSMADEVRNRFEKVLPTVIQRPYSSSLSAEEPADLSYKEALGKQENTNTGGDKMGFRELLGKKEEKEESKAEAKARAERLAAAFPNDEKFAEEQFDAGHDVNEAVQAAIAQAKDGSGEEDAGESEGKSGAENSGGSAETFAGVKAERDNLKSERDSLKSERDNLKSELDSVKSQLEEQKNTAASEKKRADDAENRVKVLGGEGTGTDDHDTAAKNIAEGVKQHNG